MKKILMLFLIGTLSLTVTTSGYASDWDKAGKALTIVEGLRLFTGGKVDVVGTITGVNHRHKERNAYHRQHYYPKEACYTKVWVPEYVWKRKYVPGHEEYHEKYGRIFVEGHYIKYKVEERGYWERTKHYCG